MPPTKTQTAVIQSKAASREPGLPLVVADTRPVPELTSPYHDLVRILAAGLNPTDYKMIIPFYMDGNPVGCDFCGIVKSAGSSSTIPVATRIIGADFLYRPNNRSNGALVQYAVCDSRQNLRVLEGWSDTQAAGLGAIGWGTACLAISDPEALNLQGRPSDPVEKPKPVLVYGGGTATGVVAIQMLKQ